MILSTATHTIHGVTWGEITNKTTRNGRYVYATDPETDRYAVILTAPSSMLLYAGDEETALSAWETATKP